MPASTQARIIIWAKAAGTCSFPDCRKPLVLEPEAGSSVPVGEIAHIVGEQPDGPRGQSPLSAEQRNQPPNLMLMCPTHHSEVDKAPQTYTVERLREFKRRHENWVRNTLQRPTFAGRSATVEPQMQQETLHSSVLPVERAPLDVYLAPPKTFDPQEIRSEVTKSAPYIFHNNQLVTFESLTKEDNAFSAVTNWRQATRESARDWWRDPDKQRLYVYLLGRCLNKITGPFGLMLDRKKNRYYFLPTEEGAERKVKYRPLNQSVSEMNVVWQPIQKSRKEPYGYWLHRAISFRFLLVSGKTWLLALRPEFHVTSNGKDAYVASEIGAKVTHKKAKMYNHDLLVEVNFWRDLLANGQPRITYRFNEQTIIIGTKLLQTDLSWPGVPGDRMPFRNVTIPENLFSLHEADELLDEDLTEEDEWLDEEEASDDTP